MIYEVISDVTIRREPRIVEYQDPATKKLITNAVGKLTIGTQREVYSTTVDKNNVLWGRVSESDAAGISEWVCIKGLNRTFMKIVDVGTSPVENLASVLMRLDALEKWARIQGYKG